MANIPDNIWQRMTKEEQYKLAFLGICGPSYYDKEDNLVVMMGSAMLNRIIEFENKMIDKYSKEGEVFNKRKPLIPIWKKEN